jgi:hypothetical protein
MSVHLRCAARSRCALALAPFFEALRMALRTEKKQQVTA